MTVKVVSKDKSMYKYITHRMCGKTLRYTDGDVNIRHDGTDISGGPDGHEGFMCPHCGRLVIVRSW